MKVVESERGGSNITHMLGAVRVESLPEDSHKNTGLTQRLVVNLNAELIDDAYPVNIDFYDPSLI